MTSRSTATLVLAAPFLALAVIGAANACSSWTPAKTAASEHAAVEVAKCVLEHADMPPKDIPAVCTGVVVEDVTAILFAANRAKLGCAPAPSASASSK